MQYRKDRYGNDISLLGFGCMRFTQSAGKIQLDKAEEEIMAAFHAGVNYFDTAYVYPGSEAAIGEIFERNGIRDQIRIATKLPHYLLKKPESAEKYFQEELRRLRTDHVDYYLMHMLTDIATWERLRGLGVDKWLMEKKKSGQIRQIGFSYHGMSDMFLELLDAWDWDFCQIQYNYMDEHSQAGRTGLEHAQKKGIPVIIMEPLRGGRLVSHLPRNAEAAIASHPSHRSAAAWAFDWLWDQEGVTCILSGMNSLDMVRENASQADRARAGMLTQEDQAFLQDIARMINEKMKVPCTGCRYCMPCTHGVDIPGAFAAYNRLYSEGRFSALKEYMMCTVLRKTPTLASNCIGCGACEIHCPQHIQIREELKNARKALEGPVIWTAKHVVPHFMKY
ncbi:MAG: aldo/keto reductase [Clostridia bacterium]|nr:aldo/keto reductase [Clostridia bacterium]